MTQAPTPGPLSGDDVNRECKACGAFKAERDAACMFCGLAPTAPVEASGSEREHGPKCWGKTSISDEMMYCYCGSTDSPSGETREALGGQKGDSETLRVLLDNLVIAQTLSKDIRQKATDEARSYLYDLRHTPQPSGETREQCAACSRGEVTHFSTDDGFWVEITTSAGGANEHGLNGWFETLEHYLDGSTKRREYVATDSPALSATPARAEALSEDDARRRLIQRIEQWDGETEYDAEDIASLADDILHEFNGAPEIARAEAQDEDTPCTDCGDTGVTHQTERRCSCQEAEAQDEGAAGKREQAIKELIAGYAVMHEVICFMAGTSGAAGRWYYEKANAAFEKVKPLHVFGNDLATHPSPTPAADADRVRIAVEALERIAEEAPFRSGYSQSDVEYGPTLSIDEMQSVARAALSHMKPE